MIVVTFMLSSAVIVFGTDAVRADSAASLPGAPTGLTAKPGANQVSLNWTAPAANGGTPIDYYIVYCVAGWVSFENNAFEADTITPINETIWRVGVDLPNPSAPGATITGLEFRGEGLSAAWTYNFTVVAHNAAGTGPKSNSVLASPYTTPDVVLLQIKPGDGQATLGWGFLPVRDVDGGSPVLYFVVFQDGVDILHTDDGNADNVTITGLTNGHAYNFSVAAHNLAGNGLSYDSMMVPMPIPDAPTGLIATAGNGTASLTWMAPQNSVKSFIDSYNVYQDGVWTNETYNNSTSFTITGLTNGRPYVFAVSAGNEAGEGPRSSSVSVTPGIKNSSEPTGLAAHPGNGWVALSWSPPVHDGGANIDYYVIYQNDTDFGHVNATSMNVTGLTNGRSYAFTVAAHNSAGLSGMSNSVQAMPFTVPDAPSGLMALAGNTQITLNWAAPDYNGGRSIDYYVVYQDGVALAGHPTGHSTVILGLVNGQLPSFTVSAHNLAGNSSRSNAAASTPSPALTVPGAPVGVMATPGNSRVSLNWTAPASNGGASVDYYVVYQDGVDVAHPASSSTIITGLSNGQSYTFIVAAHNSVGMGPQSDPVSALLLTIPGTPIGLTATPGNGQVSLSWSAPLTNGGAAIDYYVVYRNGTDVAHSASTSSIVTGLTNGVSYGFNVASHNSVGIGPMSSQVTATPSLAPTVPGVPTDLKATAGDGQVSLSWTPPGSNGGSAIDYYIIYQDGIGIEDPTASYVNVTGLSNGQSYDFTVAAHNPIGTGISSSAVTVIPQAAPVTSGIPTDLVATPGIGSVKLTWTAPSNSSAIDYYIVYQNGFDVSHVAATSTTIFGLAGGQNYTFAVAAHSSAGAGSMSPTQTARPIVSGSSGETTILGANNMVIYVGSLALLALAIVALFFMVRRRRKKV